MFVDCSTYPITSRRFTDLRQHSEATIWVKFETCEADVTIIISIMFGCEFLNLKTWSRFGIYVVCHEKYRVSTNNVAICAKIKFRSWGKISYSIGPAVCKRSKFQYDVKSTIGCVWQSHFLSHKTHLDHDNVLRSDKHTFILAKCVPDQGWNVLWS